MSNSTITVSDIALVVRQHVKLTPIMGVAGVQDQPALMIANNVIQEILSPKYNPKFNRNEMTTLVTQQFKQDYLFAGATAFVLQIGTNAANANWGGAGIDLASNNAITESGTTVTVNTLEAHPFSVGQTVYIIGTNSAYDSPYTLSNGTFSGGWTITAVPTTKSFQFTHTSSGLANSGAPGITNFGWLESASLLDVQNITAPQPIDGDVMTVRTLNPESVTGNPNRFAVIQDLGTGVLKVRCSPCPATYEIGINLVYQAKAPKLTALTNTWAPIPDEHSNVYFQGFLADAYRFVDKATYLQEFQRFQQAIVAMIGHQDAEENSGGLTPDFSLFR